MYMRCHHTNACLLQHGAQGEVWDPTPAPTYFPALLGTQAP